MTRWSYVLVSVIVLPIASSLSVFVARALELGRVLEGAGADDAALALHEARHGVHRADAAGVGQRDRRALEVGGGQLVAARAAR